MLTPKIIKMLREEMPYDADGLKISTTACALSMIAGVKAKR